MKLCSNRGEGFGPVSHLYSHILTSCFLDTILVPLCTWLYLTAILFLLSTSIQRRRSQASKNADSLHKSDNSGRRRPKSRLALLILYNFLILAQLAMCSLEMARLARAHLGIGLLPFTLVSLLVAALLRATDGFGKRVAGWRWANVGVWISLAATNSVKVAQEAKEGTGARKGTKYPESDEITDVAVMIALYVILALEELLIKP